MYCMQSEKMYSLTVNWTHQTDHKETLTSRSLLQRKHKVSRLALHMHALAKYYTSWLYVM